MFWRRSRFSHLWNIFTMKDFKMKDFCGVAAEAVFCLYLAEKTLTAKIISFTNCQKDKSDLVAHFLDTLGWGLRKSTMGFKNCFLSHWELRKSITLQIGELHFQFWQRNLDIWTITFWRKKKTPCNFDKWIWKMHKIHLVILKNRSGNLDKKKLL